MDASPTEKSEISIQEVVKPPDSYVTIELALVLIKQKRIDQE
jgi:hypothetical protein